MKRASLVKLQAGIGCIGCLGYLAWITLIVTGVGLAVVALYKYVFGG